MPLVETVRPGQLWDRTILEWIATPRYGMAIAATETGLQLVVTVR